MDRSDKHMSGAGTSRMWSKIKAKFLDKTTDGSVSGQLTISKSTGTPLILKGGTSVCILQMRDSSDTLLGSLKVTSSHVLRFNNGTADYDIYHEGNANKWNVDWSCDHLTCTDIIARGNGVGDIGDSSHHFNQLWANRMLTNSSAGLQFGISSNGFSFYDSLTSFTASNKLLSIKKSGGIEVHKGDAVIAGNVMAGQGVSAYGMSELDSGFITLDTAESLYAKKMSINENAATASSYALLTDAQPTWNRVTASGNTLELTLPSMDNATFGVVHTLNVTRGSSGGPLTITLPKSVTTPQRVFVVRPDNTITVANSTNAIIKYYYTRVFSEQAYMYIYYVFIEVINGLIYGSN